jgi:hypothetical protein
VTALHPGTRTGAGEEGTGRRGEGRESRGGGAGGDSLAERYTTPKQENKGDEDWLHII